MGREAFVEDGVVGPVPSLSKCMRMVVVGKKGANVDIPVAKVLYIEAVKGLQHLCMDVQIQGGLSERGGHLKWSF